MPLGRNTKFSLSKQSRNERSFPKGLIELQKKNKTIQKAQKQASTLKLSHLNPYLADLFNNSPNFRYSSHQNFWNILTYAAGTPGINFVNADDSTWILRKYIFNHFV